MASVVVTVVFEVGGIANRLDLYAAIEGID